MARGSRGYPYSLLLEMAIVLLLLLYLGDIKKRFSLAMMGVKDPTCLIVIIIVPEPTFLK